MNQEFLLTRNKRKEQIIFNLLYKDNIHNKIHAACPNINNLLYYPYKEPNYESKTKKRTNSI